MGKRGAEAAAARKEAARGVGAAGRPELERCCWSAVQMRQVLFVCVCVFVCLCRRWQEGSRSQTSSQILLEV